MDLLMFYTVVGFLLASYSVVANDSVQTLGTFIASNSEKFKWYYLWGPASSVLLFTLWYGWSTNGGDISFGRLNKTSISSKLKSSIDTKCFIILTYLYTVNTDNDNVKK